MYIDKNETKRLGNELKNSCDTIDNIIKSINNQITNLKTAWSGDDATSFVNSYQEQVLPSLKELNNKLEEYGTYLNKVNNPYDTLDRIYASKHIDV